MFICNCRSAGLHSGAQEMASTKVTVVVATMENDYYHVAYKTTTHTQQAAFQSYGQL